MTNYYFYIVQNLRGRLGFGIAKDYVERNKQYSAHSGDLIAFPLLYAGPEMKCKALERQFKKYTIDDIWLVDEWRTEWWNDYVTLDNVKEMVTDAIERKRLLEVKLFTTDYNFEQGYL